MAHLRKQEMSSMAGPQEEIGMASNEDGEMGGLGHAGS